MAQIPVLPEDRHKGLDRLQVRRRFDGMNRGFADLAGEALTLPAHDQLKLARRLIENAEASGEPGVEAAWEDEIERRIRRIDAGLAKGRPFADVLRDLDQRLGHYDADHPG